MLILYVTLFSSVYCHSIPKQNAAPLISLNDGYSMPAFGLGTWLGQNQKGALNSVVDDSVEKAVEAGIDAGYRHIDTAQIYFTEDQVGNAVNKKIKEGVVTREELFITTKLWNDKHARQDVVPSLKDSLERLKLDYVDLFLIHFPISIYGNLSVSDVSYLETWQGMVEAKNLGLAKSIGISNFNATQLEDLLKNTDVVPAVLQIEVNLSIQQPELRQICRDNGIVVVGYTPFGSLFTAKRGPDSPPPRADDPQLVAMAEKYKKSVAQIVLRYLFELGVVPIPKTTKRERLIENLDIFDFELAEEDKQILKSFDKGLKTFNLALWHDSKYYPF